MSLALLAGGGAAVALSGFHGPGALAGAALLALGLALVDAAARDHLSPLQAGVFLLVLGLGLGAWAAVAIVMLEFVDMPVAPELDELLAASVAGAAAGFVVVAGSRLVPGPELGPSTPRPAPLRAPVPLPRVGSRGPIRRRLVQRGPAMLRPVRPSARRAVHRPARG
jgi:hypothetical protein